MSQGLLDFDRIRERLGFARPGHGTSDRPEFERSDERFGHLVERKYLHQNVYVLPVLTLDAFQDLFSYDREQAKGDTHNMIAIMMRHHGMTLQESVDFIGDLCEKSNDRFTKDRARIPSWGPEIDAQVQVYIQGLADWIAGTLHWSFDSERYFGKKGGQVKKDRIVELSPVRIPEPVDLANSSVATEPGVRAS